MYALILTKMGLGDILGELAQTHLVTLVNSLHTQVCKHLGLCFYIGICVCI
jgi:gamma-glutamyl-gamma-aminobutyrate hydrolase PuuD